MNPSQLSSSFPQQGYVYIRAPMIRVSIVGRCFGVCEYSFFFHAKKLFYLKNKVKINNITHTHNPLVSKEQCIQPQSILQLHLLIGRVQVQQTIKHLKRVQLNHGKQNLLLTNLIRRNDLGHNGINPIMVIHHILTI